MPSPEIPFDSLVLWAVCREGQNAEGLFVEKAWQVDEFTVALALGKKESARNLLISCHPTHFRAHLVLNKPAQGEAAFGNLIRERLQGARLVSAKQQGFDRVVRLAFTKGAEQYTLVAELFGGKANIRLLGTNDRPIGSMRRVPAPKTGALSLSVEEAISTGKGLSKFLAEEVRLQGTEKVISLVSEGKPIWLPGIGAYLFHPAQYKDTRAVPMASISAALEKEYEGLQSRDRVDALRANLTRELTLRQKALSRMQVVLDDASRARDFQMKAELLLAHQTEIPEGAQEFVCDDYEGKPLTISLVPEKSVLKNAQKLFDKAKRAKRSAIELRERAERMESESRALESLLEQLESEDIDAVEEEARAAGFLRAGKSSPQKEKRERKYDGFKIREAEAPGGYRVLWGENATSNDYLTTKVAKPNDYWLHVRGAGGSHVVLQTSNKPERVQPDALAFAAQIAARHSGQKHAKHVSVTYTLAKYVRKPRKAPPGSVVVSQDKTLFVDPEL